MIPILYEPNETAFTSNGICRLRDCLSCVCTEGRNDVYEVDFSYPVTGANYDKITLGRIIGVTHDDSKDVQPFDIVSYEKPIDGVVTFHAVHISYRQSKMTVKTVKGVDDLATALAQIKHVAYPDNPFEYETDKNSLGYCGCFDGTPRSVRKILGGVEGSILDTYGGEYEWDKFTVRLLAERGQRRGFTIRYGVNLVDYVEAKDYSETYTSVVPFWKGQDDSGNEVMVIGDVIDARGEAYNGIEACIPLDLSERFESKPSKASLENVAYGLLVRTNPFLPEQNITVDFISLKDTEEYKQFEKLMECNLCDTINVSYGGEINSYKIVKTVYDVLGDRYESLELGKLETTLADLISGDQTSSMGIDGLPVYGTCDTSGSDAAKIATVSQGFILRTGAVVFIKFTNANTVAGPTLNVNSSGAIAIKRYGATNPSTSAASSWNSGSVVALVYDGTYWQMVGWLNTTYSSMTSAEATAGTGTTARIITPARLKEGILAHATPSNIGAIPTSDKQSYSSASSLSWNSLSADQKAMVPTIQGLAFWNGAYDGSSSNLKYSANGSIIGTGNLSSSGNNHTYSISANSVKSSSFTISRAGYYPICIDRINLGGTGSDKICLNKYGITARADGSVTYEVAYYNPTATAYTNITVAVYVLWAKI